MEGKEKLEEEYKMEEYYEGEDEDESGLVLRGDWHTNLINAAKKGEYQLCEKCLAKKANPQHEDKRKWSALTWAACKGHLRIVRLLLSRNAGEAYVNTPEANRRVITGAINSEAKPTPLQWASYKGHLQIFWLLLKAGMKWEDVDSFGNNSVNLAAAGGNIKVFESLLQLGVSLTIKNSRGHSCADLSTVTQISKLIQNSLSSKACHHCKLPFHEYEIKHFCWTCRKYFGASCFEVRWVLQFEKSEDKDKLEGRCKDCWQTASRHEDQLQKIIESNSYKYLYQKLQQIANNQIRIEVKLLAKAEVHLQKLRTEIEILDFLKKMEKVPNYKIILKSVHKIEELLKDAKERGVDVDSQVIERANSDSERLIAERNLRFLLDNLVSSKATIDEVKNLEEVYRIAQEKGVGAEYLEQSHKLNSLMRRGIQVQQLSKMFTQFPLREAYVPQLTFDPKTKKLLDPQTKKKPIDPESLLPVKKKPVKGKKVTEQQFPDWALESKSLQEKITRFQQLLKEKDELALGADFVKGGTELLAKMRKECQHVKSVEVLTKLVEEAKKPKK